MQVIALARRWIALLGLAVLLAGCVMLRHHGDVLDAIYQSSNFLDSNRNAGIPQDRFLHAVSGVELVLMALLIWCFVRGAANKTRALLATVLPSFVVICVDSLSTRAVVIGGHLYVGLVDDAFISMRYARNLASGSGLVYNVGQPVEGYTNPLWTLIMSIPLALGFHEGIAPAVVLAIGIALLATSAVLVQRVLARFEVEVPLQIFAMLALLFDASLLDFTLDGLETPLIAFAATLSVYGALTKREGALIAGLLLLPSVRADGTVIGVLLVAWRIFDHRCASRATLRQLFVAHRFRVIAIAGSSLAMVLWHLALYGQLGPNTYYLKMYSLSERILTGLAAYGPRGVMYYGLPVVFVLWSAATFPAARVARRMLAPIIATWFYGMYVGGDAFTHLRFVAPFTPLLWLAVALAGHAAWPVCRPAGRTAAWALLLLFSPALAERGVLGLDGNWENWMRDNLTAAKALDEYVAPGDEIAIFYAGTVPYYAPEHRFVDVLGKTEPTIAHETTIHGAIPGHNKFDFAHVYRDVRPAVTFTAMACDDVDRFLALPQEAKEARRSDLRRSEYWAPVYQLLDPSFVELYAPNRVVARRDGGPTGHTVGCWYIRKDANVPLVWQLATL